MLKEKLDELIKESIKSREMDRLSVIRIIKSAFMEYETAKNAKPLDDAAEISILKKLASQYAETRDGYIKVGNKIAADEEAFKISVVKEFLPEEVSEDILKSYAASIIGDCRDMKQMGKFMSQMKNKYPGADGKVLSGIIKGILCS